MNNNSEDKNQDQQEEPMTEEERRFAEELDQKISNAQQKLDQLGLTESRISWLQDTIKKRQEENPMTDEEKKEKFQQMADKAIDIPSIDRQGRKIFTLEETLNNYNNAWGILKYRELPICWSNLKDKIIFTLPMTFMAAYTYEAMQLKKINLSLKEMKLKLLGRSWGVFFVIGTTFCLIDSLYFDDFCDIKSYHYQTNDRKKLVRELRSQLLNKPNKKDQN